MKKNLKDKKSLNIAMLGHKRIPSREGGIEIVVEELATRMVTLGHKVTCYNRSGHHVSGKDFDGGKRKAYKGVRLKSVLTLDKKGLAAMTASVSGAICAAFGKYDVVHFHIVKNFEAATGMKVPYVIKDRRPGDIATCYCDPGKAAKELDWKAENGIKEMCEDSWRWQKKNPNGYEG